MGVSSKLPDYLTVFGAREMVRGSLLGEYYTGSFQAFYVNSDATITSLLDKDNVEVSASYGLNINNTLYQGAYIAAPSNTNFNKVTLTTGNVIILTTGSSYSE
jgi:hypothetical protein